MGWSFLRILIIQTDPGLDRTLTISLSVRHTTSRRVCYTSPFTFHSMRTEIEIRILKCKCRVFVFRVVQCPSTSGPKTRSRDKIFLMVSNVPKRILSLRRPWVPVSFWTKQASFFLSSSPVCLQASSLTTDRGNRSKEGKKSTILGDSEWIQLPTGKSAIERVGGNVVPHRLPYSSPFHPGNPIQKYSFDVRDKEDRGKP